jgi:hypothetical protein
VPLFPLLTELPDVELQAAGLDGECYRLGEGFLPIGIGPSHAARAAAAIGDRSPRLVAALDTAAWVWRARTGYPATREYLVDLGARWRPSPTDRIVVVESVIRAGEVVRFGEAAVTSPLRTTIDLARFRTRFDAGERATLRRLSEVGGFGLAEALSALEGAHKLPGKRRAGIRLQEALGGGGQPEFTR